MSEQTYQPALCQHLKAPNDTNGNPRRVFVIYDAAGNILDAVDEGYAGRPQWVRALPELPSFSITATEYREILRDWSAVRAS